MHPRPFESWAVIHNRLHCAEVNPSRGGATVKRIKAGDKVKVLSGPHAGKVGVFQSEGGGKIFLRLRVSDSNTAERTIGFRPQAVERQIEVAKER
ncbi:MAG: KOW motif-containing protein [Candidatus Acidiferrum sp.]